MIARVRYGESFGNKSIDVMELGNKAKRTLVGRNILTMENLMDFWDKLPTVKGVGEKTVKEIKSQFFKAYMDSLSEDKQVEFLKRIMEDNTIKAKEVV